jgi:hypothetical protein
MRRYRYWNANGFAVAIVCKEGGAKDYAAYIGATSGSFRSEAETVQFVEDYGSKLDPELTDHLFPEFKEAGLVWRP